MNIFDGPCPEILAHVPTAPGAGALATGRRTLPSVGTRIFTAALSWRPPGGPTVSLGTVGYQVWEHAFSLQRRRGALLAVEKTHWAACT